MFKAIVQAIDHAMGRTQEGMGSGIKVADSQHGSSATSSPVSGNIADTSTMGNSLKNSVNTMKETVNEVETKGDDKNTDNIEENKSEISSVISDKNLKDSDKIESARKHASNTVKNWHRS